jgi:hypothetical protein
MGATTVGDGVTRYENALGGDGSINVTGNYKVDDVSITGDAVELNVLDGVTAGTVTASKAVVVDANKDAATFRNITLSGNLVQGTTTISETDIAKIDGITNGTVAASKAVVVDANKDANGFRNLTLTGTVASNAGAGAAAGTGVAATEYGDGVVHKTVLALTAASVPITRESGDSSGWGALKIYDFPEGRIALLGTTATITGTGGANIADAGSGDFSLGSTATVDTTLDTTDIDMGAKAALTDPFVAKVGSGTTALASMAQFDGTTTAKDLYLNVIIDAGDVATGNTTMAVTGTVTLTWINLGDY